MKLHRLWYLGRGKGLGLQRVRDALLPVAGQNAAGTL
jgi:hypothetical protein